MHQIEAVSKDDVVRRCRRHRTKVASHTVVPLGTAKWLERNSPHKNLACPWVGDKGCVCPLPKGKV